ncbi:MAG: hypothetical protein AB7O52_15960 [Planctomycetota bacterium]
MKNNVFWGVLGAILVVWAATFWFLGWAAKAESDEKNAGLASEVRTLERLSKKTAAEFPSEELKALRESELARTRKSYEDALGYMRERDQKLEHFLTDSQEPTLVEWEARYRDAFRGLGDEYRAFAALPADAKLPFPENTGIQNQASLPEYQKRFWGLQALVRSLMKFPGSAIENVDFDDKPKELGRLDKNEFHDRKQWRLDASMAAANVPKLITDLLTHDFVTFELHRLIVTKTQQSLKGDVVEVQAKDEPWAGEPLVRVRLIVNALDWKYVPPESGE